MITMLARLTSEPRSMTRLLRPVSLGVLAQLSAVGLMAVSAWLLSRAAQHPPVLYLMCAIVAVRALGLARGVFRYRERLAGHDIALGMQARLRVRAYQRLADGSPLHRSGDLLTRVTSDLDAVQDLVVRVIVPVASSGLVIVAAGAALSVITPAAGALLLVGSVISGAVLPWCAGRLAARAADQLVPLRAELADEVAEVGRCREDLVAFGAERGALDRLAAIDSRLAAAERRTAWTSGLMTALQWLITGAVIIGGMITGGREVAAGRLDPVFLAVLALTPLALHDVVAALPATAVVWRRTRAALRRTQELIIPAEPGQRPARMSAGPGLGLAMHKLTAGWPGAEPAVRDVDLEVRCGERVALVGPSGVGKSTLAATVMGFLPALAGSIAVADRIGYLAQDAHIFDTTVAENVRIGARGATDDQVRRALAEVDLDLSLDRPVGEFGAAVSGGEARRLALARLAVSRLVDGDHQLLVLDEPTEHLDRDTADHVLDVIGRLDRSAAVLVITHDPRVMERCDRVVSLTGAPASDESTVPEVISPVP
jgi:thiol reductant ABC exporter CydC subunit